MTRRPRVFLGHAISALATLPMIYELLLNRDKAATHRRRDCIDRTVYLCTGVRDGIAVDLGEL